MIFGFRRIFDDVSQSISLSELAAQRPRLTRVLETGGKLRILELLIEIAIEIGFFHRSVLVWQFLIRSFKTGLVQRSGQGQKHQGR